MNPKLMHHAQARQTSGKLEANQGHSGEIQISQLVRIYMMYLCLLSLVRAIFRHYTIFPLFSRSESNAIYRYFFLCR
jgi:hypothetical protein